MSKMCLSCTLTSMQYYCTCLDLNIFQQDECFCFNLGMEVEHAKSNLKTSLSQIWVICQLLPFVRVGQNCHSMVQFFFLKTPDDALQLCHTTLNPFRTKTPKYLFLRRQNLYFVIKLATQISVFSNYKSVILIFCVDKIKYEHLAFLSDPKSCQFHPE